MAKKLFPIYVISNEFYSNSNKAFTLEDNKKLGEKKSGKIVYSNFEVYYLIEKNYAKILKNNKELSKVESSKILSTGKKFLINFSVFRYLREKGYIVKTGSKFGSIFRVYDNSSINSNHAKWIVHIEEKKDKIDIEKIISKIRISHSSGKKLLLAIVDFEFNIIFYEIDWIKI